VRVLFLIEEIIKDIVKSNMDATLWRQYTTGRGKFVCRGMGTFISYVLGEGWPPYEGRMPDLILKELADITSTWNNAMHRNRPGCRG
jgi:hypothetical protein